MMIIIIIIIIYNNNNNNNNNKICGSTNLGNRKVIPVPVLIRCR